MPSITKHGDRQSAGNLAFCYLCGEPLLANEQRSRDHVPPKTCFASKDRDPLVLPAHTECIAARSVTDKQVGQLIGLIHGKRVSRRDNALDILHINLGKAAVVNIDIPAEIWRWIRAFHAALYRSPYPNETQGSLTIPFPSAPTQDSGQIEFDPIKPQHYQFVETIKLNRALGNLDVIRCNKDKLIYECVWCLSDDETRWLCIFALDIYGWKNLGNSVVQPSRGCAGMYTLPNGLAPEHATRSVRSSIIPPNIDKLDPFGP